MISVTREQFESLDSELIPVMDEIALLVWATRNVRMMGVQFAGLANEPRPFEQAKAHWKTVRKFTGPTTRKLLEAALATRSTRNTMLAKVRRPSNALHAAVTAAEALVALEKAGVSKVAGKASGNVMQRTVLDVLMQFSKNWTPVKPS